MPELLSVHLAGKEEQGGEVAGEVTGEMAVEVAVEMEGEMAGEAGPTSPQQESCCDRAVDWTAQVVCSAELECEDQALPAPALTILAQRVHLPLLQGCNPPHQQADLTTVTMLHPAPVTDPSAPPAHHTPLLAPGQTGGAGRGRRSGPVTNSIHLILSLAALHNH